MAIISPFVGHTFKTLLYLPALQVMVDKGEIGFYNSKVFQLGQWIQNSIGISLDYQIGNELILITGIFTVLGLLLISKK